MKTLTILLALMASYNAQISFNYQKIKASDVVYSISKLTETTIVAPEIKTLISLQAKNVSKDEALHILQVQLSTMKYTMVKEGDLYVVQQVSKIAQETPLIVNQNYETKIFKVEYANALALSKIITDVMVTAAQQKNRITANNFLANKGTSDIVYLEMPPSISADSFSNSIIVRGVASQINEAERLFGVLDVKGNIVWTTKVHLLKYAKAKDLSPVLTQAFSIITNGNYTSISNYDLGNALVVTCPEKYVMQFDNLITCLDAKAILQDNTKVFKIWNGNTITLSNLLNQIGKKR